MCEHTTTECAQLFDSSLGHFILVDFAEPARALRDPAQKCQPYLEEAAIGGVVPRQRKKRTTNLRDLFGVPRGQEAARKRRAIARLASGAPVSDAAFDRKREGAIEAAMKQNPLERGAELRSGAFTTVAASLPEALAATITMQ